MNEAPNQSEQNRNLLRVLAIAHRRVVKGVLIYLILVLLFGVIQGMSHANLLTEEIVQGATIVCWLGIVGLIIFCIGAINKLGNLLGAGQGMGCLFVICLAIPFAGLALLLWLSQKSTKVLRANGVTVGLMGAELDSI